MAGKKTHRLRNRLLLSVAILLGVWIFGVLGFVALGWEWGDAIYMVVITVFGIGYGEVEPVVGFHARFFTIMFIICGYTAAVYVVGELIRTITEGEIANALGDVQQTRRLEGISHHTIICGFGRIGQILAAELVANGVPFVVVDLDKERIALARELNYLVVEGSATEEETLLKAGIPRADVLATVLPQDTLNVFITLTARNLNKDIRIIARGEQPTTEKKLRQAGATEVVLPAAIGGLRIAHSITKPALRDFLGGASGGTDFHHLGLEVHEFALEPGSKFEGWNVGEIQRKAQGGIMVVAVRRSGGEIVRKDIDSLMLEAGDALIVMGRLNGMPEFLKGGAKDVGIA